MFRSVEDGTPIDFILTSPLRDAASAEALLVPAAKFQPGDGDNPATSNVQHENHDNAPLAAPPTAPSVSPRLALRRDRDPSF